MTQIEDASEETHWFPRVAMNSAVDSVPKAEELKVKPQMVPKAENSHKKHEETRKTGVPAFGQYLACFRGSLCLFVAILAMAFSV